METKGPAAETGPGMPPEPDSTSLQRYPSPRPLEAQLAKRFGLEPDSVLVTAGGDEGLMRICRAFLGRTDVCLSRALLRDDSSVCRNRRRSAVCSLLFQGYPTEAVLAACDEKTAMVAVVSPNNPTGGIISAADLSRLSSLAAGMPMVVGLRRVCR